MRIGSDKHDLVGESLTILLIAADLRHFDMGYEQAE